MGVRLWTPFVLVALISIVAVAVMLYVSVNTQRDQTAFVQREVAQRLAAQAGGYIAKLQNDVRAAANVAELSAQFDTTLARVMENIRQDEPGFMEIAVVGADGIERARVTRPDAPAATAGGRSATLAFMAAITGSSYLGPVRALNDFPVVTLAEPIVTQSGQVVGVVTALVDLTVLWDRVADSPVGQRGYAFIVDNHGTLVAYRDLRAAPPNLMMLYLPVVSDAIAAGVESGTTRTYNTSLASPAEPTLAYYTPFALGDIQWYVIVEQPLADALAQVNKLMLAGLGLLLAAVASIVFMGFYIARRVAAPIAQRATRRRPAGGRRFCAADHRRTDRRRTGVPDDRIQRDGAQVARCAEQSGRGGTRARITVSNRAASREGNIHVVTGRPRHHVA